MKLEREVQTPELASRVKVEVNVLKPFPRVDPHTSSSPLCLTAELTLLNYSKGQPDQLIIHL